MGKRERIRLGVKLASSASPKQAGDGYKSRSLGPTLQLPNSFLMLQDA